MPDGRDAAAIFGRWPCPPTKVHANANWDKLATADDPHSEGKAADEEEDEEE
jgi:hypothetical protein